MFLEPNSSCRGVGETRESRSKHIKQKDTTKEQFVELKAEKLTKEEKFRQLIVELQSFKAEHGGELPKVRMGHPGRNLACKLSY